MENINVTTKTIKQEILERIKVTEKGYVGIHKQEEIDNAVSQGSIYERESNSVIPGMFSTKTLKEMMTEAQINLEKGIEDNSNSEVFLDEIKIGSEDPIQVSATKAANKTFNSQNNINYLVTRMMGGLSRTEGSLEELKRAKIRQKPVKLPKNGKTTTEDGVLKKEYTYNNFALSHMTDQDDRWKEEEVYDVITDWVCGIKSVLLKDALVSCSSSPEQTYKSEAVIVNNRNIREVIEKQVELRFSKLTETEKQRMVRGISERVNDSLGIAPLTAWKLRFGIDVSDVAKTSDPKWISGSSNKTFKVSKNSYMRITRLADCCSEIPVNMEKLAELQGSIEKIETAFAMWAECDTCYHLGLKLPYTVNQILALQPLTSTEDAYVWEVLGLSEETVIQIETEIREKVNEIIEKTISDLRTDQNADALKSLSL